MSEELGMLKQSANSAVAWAKDLTVENEQDANRAKDFLASMAGVKKRWLEYWKPVKESAKKAHSDICAKEKEVTDFIDETRQIAESKIMAWQRIEREKAEAEQRRLQAVADEQARKERERLEREAAKLKTAEKKEERLEQAAAVVAPVVTITAPKMSGTVERWAGEVADKAALLKMAGLNPNGLEASFLTINESALNKFAGSTKGTVQVAGVKWTKSESLSIRGR